VANRFGAYEILYELKTGGMGAVLLGRRRGPGAFEQLVAIKTIRPEFAQTAAVRAMFLDEAAILARLNHPAIATVHDFGEQGGTLYMVMEYVAGIAFRDAMIHGLPPAIVARAIAEACRGVHAAHELRDLAGGLLGVVHRDISPDNLMFGFDGHIKVIDFGIALIKNRQAPVTELGTLKGKPPYMSPEQVKNEAIDRRSDVFSLAVVLWEMLTGRALFGGDSIYAIALAVEHQELVPPSQAIGAALPAGLDAVVMRALERDVARRTPSAAELAEQLEQVIQTAGDETLESWAERALDEPRRQHRAWLASVAAGRDAVRPIGRSTGAVTALSPHQGAPQIGPGPAQGLPALPGHGQQGLPRLGDLPAAQVQQGPPRPVAPAGAARAGAPIAPPPRRSHAVAILLALAVLLAVGGALYVTRRATVPSAPRDAGVLADAIAPDATTAPPDAAPLAIDAAELPVVPIDAELEPPIDAGRRRPIRALRDAGRSATRDAEPAAPPAEPAVASFGTITAKHTAGRFLNIVIDGHLFDSTPVFGKPLPTGTHTIELVDPQTSRVVVKRTVKLDAGQAITITEP
jgi:serine/threonine-protein kinase